MTRWLEIYSNDLFEEEQKLDMYLSSEPVEDLGLDVKAEAERLLDDQLFGVALSRPLSDFRDERRRRLRGPSSAMCAVAEANAKIVAMQRARCLRESRIRENVVGKKSVSLVRRRGGD